MGPPGIIRRSWPTPYPRGMDALITLGLRLLVAVLCSSFLLGLLCALAALYAVGSEWPALSAAALAVAWLGLWGFALWRLVRG